MKRTKADLSDVARDDLAPAAEGLVQAAADRVGPLAQAAADKLEAAGMMIGPLAHSAADKLEPLAHRAADKVAPLAQQAADRVGPLAQQAADVVTPLAQQVSDRVNPLATNARERGTQAASEAIEKWGPALEEALARISPALGSVRGRVQDDLVPKIIEALGALAASPTVVEATKRGQATLAAARGELTLPEPAPAKPRRRWIGRVLVIAAVGGVIVVVARRLLGGQDADWQAARPTTPYAPPTSAGADASAGAPASNGQSSDTVPADTVADVAADATLTGVEDVPLGDVTEAEVGDVPVTEELVSVEAVDAGGPAAGETVAGETVAGAPAVDAVEDATPESLSEAAGQDVLTEEAVLEVPVDEDADTDTAAGADFEAEEDGTAPEGDRSRFSGEGVYVGSEPPEGFTIKGNERSMKYHVPESAGYARTISEVWFNSEEAAQEAGFVRAQR